jgi:hypothetical protein
MFNASQAVQLSQSYNQEANYVKMHDFWIDTIESMVQRNAKAGETSTSWVPSLDPENTPKVVRERTKATLIEAGYTVNIDPSTNVWKISWT